MANVLKNDFSGYTHVAAGQKVCSEMRIEFNAAVSRFWIFASILSLTGLAIVLALKTRPVVYGTIQAVGIACMIWWATLVAPSVIRLHRANAQLRAVEQGLAGELAVANALATGLDDCHYIINDITIALGEQETQIDHVVVSDSEVICVETKNWHGIYRPGDTGWLWEPLSHRRGRPRWHKDPQVQSKMHSQALKEYLLQLGFSTPVQPLVVLADQTAQWHGDFDFAECPVLHLDQLINYISQRSQQGVRTHNSREVANIVLHAHIK